MYYLAKLPQDRCSRASCRLLVIVALLITTACLTGCVSISSESVTEPVGADELSDHVQFLSQPVLKGRKPRTHGSAIARRYISSRFASYGLVPWGQTGQFAQSFRLGTNMIGVLPGADPNLADEMVIVCARYDHLGKTEKGLCLGASGNASGVAALLEIAESLAASKKRPKRSVCFAAFDCEESLMLGSLAFTCRDDFDDLKIAGVVNVDMLGRDAFVVLDDYLFMTGTERYPDLRRQIQARAPDGITLLAIGTEIVGPRGDHVAFATLDSPVLFFSCGPHKDYHRPSDTAEKLDYQVMEKSVRIVGNAIETLADSDHRYRPNLSEDGDIEELKAIKLCLSRIRNGYETMGWLEAEAQRLDPVIAEVDRLLSLERYTRQDRLRLLRAESRQLMPLAVWPDLIRDPNDPNKPGKTTLDDSMIVVQTMFMEHQAMFVLAARATVKSLLSQHLSVLSLLSGRTIHSTVLVTDVPDHLIFVEPVESSRYRLECLSLNIAVDARIGLSGRRLGFACFATPIQCMGTRDELIDYSLLCSRHEVRHAAGQRWLRLLRHVTGGDTTYEQALQSRLARGGWPDEKAWIRDCAASRNPEVRRMAIETAPRVLGREAEPVILRMLSDPNATARDRQTAIGVVDRSFSGEVLTALTSLLSDQTETESERQRRYAILTRPGTPFEGYPLLPLVVKDLKDSIEKNGQTLRTISDYAEVTLWALTKQKLGKDAGAWRRWIEANWDKRKAGSKGPAFGS